MGGRLVWACLFTSFFGLGRSLSVISAHSPNSSAECPGFLKSLGGVVDGFPTWDSTVLMWDLSAQMGNNNNTRKGVMARKSFPNLNPRGVVCSFVHLFICSFCSFVHTMFNHKGVHLCTQDALGRRSIIRRVVGRTLLYHPTCVERRGSAGPSVL